MLRAPTPEIIEVTRGGAAQVTPLAADRITLVDGLRLARIDATGLSSEGGAQISLREGTVSVSIGYAYDTGAEVNFGQLRRYIGRLTTSSSTLQQRSDAGSSVPSDARLLEPAYAVLTGRRGVLNEA